MSGKPLFNNRIDRQDHNEKESGDCERCQYFMAEESTCLLWLDETYSYESCAAWKEKSEAENGSKR